jgi:hypothetical protein
LTNLTQDKIPFVWDAAASAAFDALKAALCSAPVLLIPDPTKPYTLNCDACGYAIGATLQQDHGNGLQPVAYMSRKLKDAELNYDPREKEFMASSMRARTGVTTCTVSSPSAYCPTMTLSSITRLCPI